MATTPRKAPSPVAKLRETKPQIAQSRKARPAGSKLAQPAAKPAPAKPAAEYPAAKAKVEKVTYSATARCGKVNSRVSATPLVAAIDVRVSGKKQPHWSAGVVVGFYADASKAEAAAASINSGAAGSEWSDAIVVPVKVVS